MEEEGQTQTKTRKHEENVSCFPCNRGNNFEGIEENFRIFLFFMYSRESLDPWRNCVKHNKPVTEEIQMTNKYILKIQPNWRAKKCKLKYLFFTYEIRK